MLREIRYTSQRPGEPKRRWFSGSQMDLFIWQNEADEIVSYQLTYDKPHSEKAVVWDDKNGISHLEVDDGLNPGGHPGSPVLVPDGAMNHSKIISMLLAKGEALDSSIKCFIVERLEAHFEQ